MLKQQGRFSAFIVRLAIIATALSVAAMIAAVAMIAGFKHEIKAKLFNFWGEVIVTPFTPSASTIISPDPVTRNTDIEQKILALNGVEQMAPFVARPAILNANGMMEGIQLKGVDDKYDFTSIHATSLNFADTAYSKEIILSKKTLDRMKVKEGEDILLYFLDEDKSYPRIRKVTVSGTYNTGMEDIDKYYAICDIRLLQRIMQWSKDEVNGYQLSISHGVSPDSVASRIFYNILPEDNRLYPSTMQEAYPAIYDWLNLQDVNALVALIIMAFVAIIDLIAALLILIVEHARMVGVLKTLGMAETDMRKVFLYHAAYIGGIGVLLGNILGLGLCILQQQTGFLTLSEATYYMQYVPIKLVWWHPVAISIVTLVLCILCMWLPTLYIRRILPAKVLQFK